MLVAEVEEDLGGGADRALGGAAAGQHRHQPPGQGPVELGEQLVEHHLLGRVVDVEGAVGDAGSGGDVGHVGAGEAPGDEAVAGGVAHEVARLLLLRPAGKFD